MVTHRKLSLPLIAAKFIHTERILKTMQIQLNSIHSLYSSKTCRYVHAKGVTLRKRKKKTKNTHQNMTKIKLKKIINKHNLYFI